MSVDVTHVLHLNPENYPDFNLIQHMKCYKFSTVLVVFTGLNGETVEVGAA